MIHRYVLALGSNMRVPRIGGPARVLDAAVAAFAPAGINPVAVSRTVASRPIGPSQRLYANAAVLAECRFAPEAMLEVLHGIEHDFGRERRGVRWRARALDLDIVLWSGGWFRSAALVIPHRAFRSRDFVLRPAAQIAPDWRDPVTGLTVRQLAARAA